MLRYEVTRDPALLDQYYRLREDCFRAELHLRNFDGSEEESDRHGHILVARRGKFLVGGVRIAAAPAESVLSGELAADAASICIWERLVCHPQERAASVSRTFLLHLIDHCRRLDYTHAVVLSSLDRARYYRIFHSSLGVPFDILRPAPEFAKGDFMGMEHFLSVSHVGASQALAAAPVACSA